MTAGYDVIVLGLGGMGSAAAAHLATRGARTLGLEQFTAAHALGSSHGDSRIIRQAYFEDPAYVPLLRRAYELFEDLAHDDDGILTETGGLMVGSADSATVAGSLRSAQHWDLPHELLDADEITRRFPTLLPSPGTVALYEERAGFVRPERTVRAHLDRAARAGAALHFDERASTWTADESGVSVTTARATYRADRLVITAGAWAPSLLAGLGLPLSVTRQVQFWFEPPGGTGPFRAQPIFIWELTSDLQIYGFPAIDGPGGGVKIATFRGGSLADPDRLDRDVSRAEVEAMRALLIEHLPSMAGEFVRAVACMYTTTPDQHFVIAPHPDHRTVAIAAGFSGHGFKFVPVVGEILADLALNGTTGHPIALFDPARFDQ